MSAETAVESEVIAVSAAAFKAFGCPYCGFRSGYNVASVSGKNATASWLCGECQKPSAILAEGVTESAIGFGANGFRPTLQDHPRYGTPSHGKPDKRPEGGGEFFRSRGIGSDEAPGCFVCGGDKEQRHSIAALVETKEAAERIRDRILKKGARIDYRPFEPDHVQVKVGSCDKHLPNLEALNEAVSDGIITRKQVRECIHVH